MRFTVVATILTGGLLGLYAKSWWPLGLSLPFMLLTLSIHAAAASAPREFTPLDVLRFATHLAFVVAAIITGVMAHWFLESRPGYAGAWVDAFYTAEGAAVFFGACAGLGGVVAWRARRGR